MASRALNPRTASRTMSIWSPLGEAQFQRSISTLWKATRGRPKDPQCYSLALQKTPDDGLLPVALEVQITNGIAFIAAAKKGVEFVSAVAIETPRNPSDGLRLNLAANEDVSQAVKDCLDEIITSERTLTGFQKRRPFNAKMIF
ncbi:hypothetical protein HRR83_001899 [Exophiala dermatitidis]|nr:hypothetical protein HRR73_005030 [Exophiala dermatitidis]KAJ4526702.1 hypothetical protein HRR74_001902 [Exophiala dermatitidis]KAJ4532045.1 hypothetical protein HRR76_007048 [Exophiala dermatitidis]KAJ4546079.1 hypothetical protein HRR77_004620 [Exophiala dermatitidis]KAJ4567673.1 hypothetical protein HRR79_005183 [Exophiala dermatitidis]